MRVGRRCVVSVLSMLVGLGVKPAAADAVQASASAPRQAAHAQALGRIGRSGLRRLLAASSGIGDLQNRAGTYRLVDGLEQARLGSLQGELAGLEDALGSPTLPQAQREALRERRDATIAEIGSVPAYEATYDAATLQGEALIPSGFVASRPLFLLFRLRGHARWGGAHDLGVFSEAASVAPLLLLSDRWLVAPGLVLGRTDVDIAPFDGSSGATSVGPSLHVGGVLTEALSVSLQLAHAWSSGTSTILRPGPGGPTQVRSDVATRAVTAKVEALGFFDTGSDSGTAFTVGPQAGLYLLRSRDARVERNAQAPPEAVGAETLAVARAGASVATRRGRWAPSAYLGWESELTRRDSALVDDPHAVLAGASLGWTWGRGRRVSLDWSFIRGLRGRRRVAELTVVVVLDGS